MVAAIKENGADLPGVTIEQDLHSGNIMTANIFPISPGIQERFPMNSLPSLSGGGP